MHPSEHGTQSQGAAQGIVHFPWGQLDAQVLSAQGAQGSLQALPHREWLQRTSQGCWHGGQALSLWHVLAQLWRQAEYFRLQTCWQMP